MSYEQLSASVDALAATNAELTTTVLAVQAAAVAARDDAEAHAIDSLAAAAVAQAAALDAGNVTAQFVTKTSFNKSQYSLSVTGYGAICDGLVDDTVAIQATLDAAKLLGFGFVHLGKTHTISSTIVIPVGITLIGQGRDCKIVLSSTGTFTQGFAFLINSTDGTTWTTQYPNTISGGLKNIVLSNEDQIAGRRGVRGFGSCIIEDLRGRYMAQMVSRPSALYCDNFVVRSVYCEPVMGTDYQVDIRGLGDGLVVEGLHFPYNPVNPGDGTPNSLYVSGAIGGRVGECIGGNYYFKQTEVTVDNGHFERAQVTVDSASVEFKSTVFAASNKLPLILLATDGHNYSASLENCKFIYTEGLLEWKGSDIRINGSFLLSIKNSYKKFSKNGNLSVSQLAGLKIEKSDGSALVDWNDFSSTLSKSGHILPNALVDKRFGIHTTTNSFTGLSSASLDSVTTWTSTSGTYYYQAQNITDRVRLIGRNGAAEKSVAIVNAASGARLDVDFAARPQHGLVRIYRGSATGSYNKYVDIPVYNLYRLYDNGTSLNGVDWIDRTAGAVDSLNGLGDSFIQYEGDNVMIRAATIPTLGTWQIGDDILRSSPTAGGTRGWVNTTTGWKTVGTIAA